jgi:phosphatidylethanolamine-binding protein (PEBP) family uncharacterized protein
MKGRRSHSWCCADLVGAAAPSGSTAKPESAAWGGGVIPPLLMKTDAFEDGGIIPERYAGRGGNIRPGFTFSNVPAGTVSFAIILQDLAVAASGADGVLHWLAWNIPAEGGAIPEGPLPEGSVVGTAGVGRGTTSGLAHRPAPGTIITSFELYAR